jgi:plasmid stability protein
MATLHIRNVPDELYNRIQQLAEQHRRSLRAQILTMLERALEEENARQNQAELLASIRARRIANPLPDGAPDTLTLLREDRNH